MYIILVFIVKMLHTHIAKKSNSRRERRGIRRNYTHCKPSTLIIHSTLEDSLKCKSKEHFWVCECLQCTELFIVYWFLSHFQTATGRHAELFEILGQRNLFNPIGREESDPIEKDIYTFTVVWYKTITGWLKYS